MSLPLKGALIEYGIGLLGPIPNVVLFQFNPESITRMIEIPPRPTGATSREVSQVGEHPVEKLSFTAHFSVQERLAAKNPLTLAFGLGPQLAALDKMARPDRGSPFGKLVDLVGGLTGGKPAAVQPIPREKYPRLMFLWGTTRILPVFISSMEIVEQQYDQLLNPIRAEVRLTLSVVTPDSCAGDILAEGATAITEIVRETMVVANLSNTIPQIVDLVKF